MKLEKNVNVAENLQEIELDNNTMVGLVKFCPSIRSFGWSEVSSDVLLEELSKVLQEQRFRQLKSLHVPCPTDIEQRVGIGVVPVR